MNELVRHEPGQMYVVDDDPHVSQFIVHLLRSAGYSVEAFGTAEGFLNSLNQATSRPIAFLTDLLLPRMTGLSLCRELIAKKVACAFAVISGNADVPATLEAARLGAVDVLEKPFSRRRLLETANKVALVAQENHNRQIEEQETARRLQLLSPREREVFDAVANGWVSKTIASRLGISIRTVEVHRSHVMRKLNVESPWQLASILVIAARACSASIRP